MSTVHEAVIDLSSLWPTSRLNTFRNTVTPEVMVGVIFHPGTFRAVQRQRRAARTSHRHAYRSLRERGKRQRVHMQSTLDIQTIARAPSTSAAGVPPLLLPSQNTSGPLVAPARWTRNLRELVGKLTAMRCLDGRCLPPRSRRRLRLTISRRSFASITITMSEH